MASDPQQECQATQTLSQECFASIVEGTERALAVRDGTKVGDIIKCFPRQPGGFNAEWYFLARVSLLYGGVAQIAITHVHQSKVL